MWYVRGKLAGIFVLLALACFAMGEAVLYFLGMIFLFAAGWMLFAPRNG
jgi:hypothetical protein